MKGFQLAAITFSYILQLSHIPYLTDMRGGVQHYRHKIADRDKSETLHSEISQ